MSTNEKVYLNIPGVSCAQCLDVLAFPDEYFAVLDTEAHAEKRSTDRPSYAMAASRFTPHQTLFYFVLCSEQCVESWAEAQC